MPYEVSMSGGSPWGFRLNGGRLADQPITISRITPGGKAAQANVMQGDVLVAVNGIGISDLDLSEIMEQVKISGWDLRMTLLSQEEIELSLKKKRRSEANFTSVSEQERPKSQQLMITQCSERPSSRMRSPTEKLIKLGYSSGEDHSQESRVGFENGHSTGNGENINENILLNHRTKPKFVIKLKSKQNSKRDRTKQRPPRMENRDVSVSPAPIEDEQANVASRSVCSPVKQSKNDLHECCPSPQPPTPAPKPRKNKPKKSEENTVPEKGLATESNAPGESEHHEKKLPDSIRRQLKVQKPLPEFKPGVMWLHDKLRLTKKQGNSMANPGNTVKLAAAAYPCQRIEIDGPLSATIVHAQYNTPVGMYSADQIVNTLVNTAAAKGAEVTDPHVFGDQHVPVDTNTPVYKFVHKRERASPAPAQSRSIQILDALLDYHDGELPQMG